MSPMRLIHSVRCCLWQPHGRRHSCCHMSAPWDDREQTVNGAARTEIGLRADTRRFPEEHPSSGVCPRRDRAIGAIGCTRRCDEQAISNMAPLAPRIEDTIVLQRLSPDNVSPKARINQRASNGRRYMFGLPIQSANRCLPGQTQSLANDSSFMAALPVTGNCVPLGVGFATESGFRWLPSLPNDRSTVILTP